MKTKRNIGDELIEGLEQIVALDAGKSGSVIRVRRVPRTARESKVPEAPEYSYRRVSELRARMKLSQPLFAQALNVSPETVRAWEQGKRRPDGAALRLLQVTEKQPSLLLSMVREKVRSSRYASGRATRAAVRRATWGGRQIRLAQEGVEDPVAAPGRDRLAAVTLVSAQAFAVARSRPTGKGAAAPPARSRKR